MDFHRDTKHSQWFHPCLQPKQLFHGKRATAHAGIQTVGTSYWNLLPENPAINIWKNWSKCFYFYHTPSFLSYNVLCIKGIWQKTKKKTKNCELRSRITAQSLAWPSVWWHCFLCRILIQVLCCTVQILLQKELLNSIIRQLIGGQPGRSGNKCVSTFLSYTTSISKANILLSLQQVLSLHHRHYFLAMSHLTWDPTPVQGPAAMNLWAILSHHKYPRDRAGIQSHSFLMLEKESWMMVTNNATFLPTTFQHCSVLYPTCKGRSSEEPPGVPAPTKSIKSSLLSRTRSRVLPTARQWVC